MGGVRPSSGPSWVRGRLPGRRAAFGGLLVAAAMVAAFALSARGEGVHTEPVVVARAELSPGAPLDADSLRVEHVDLPPALAARAFSDVDQLAGGVALAPMAAGELVQRSSVLLPGEQRGSHLPRYEYSLALDTDRAVGGALVPGEVVDVIATAGSGEAAYTRVVAHEAVVLGVAGGGGFGPSVTTTVTLGLPSLGDVLQLAHANETGAVSVVRTTRAERGEPPPPPYRPQAPR